MSECHCGKDGHPLRSINCPACSEAAVDRVARAINRASSNHHKIDPGEEERMWRETQMVRRAQAAAAIAAYVGSTRG